MYDKCSDCEYGNIENLKVENRFLKEENEKLKMQNQKYKEVIDKIKEVCDSIPSTHSICGIEKIHYIEDILKEVG